CGLIVAEHQVQILDGLPGRALAEIVDGGEDAKRLRSPVEHEGELAKVRRSNIAELRQLTASQQPDEAGASITGFVSRDDILFRGAAARSHKDLRQNTPRDGSRWGTNMIATSR